MFDKIMHSTNKMNILVILISVLVSVICVLLALLQHYYFIYVHQRKPFIKYSNPFFEDLIPTDENNNHALGYLLTNFDDNNDNHILSNLNAVLESHPKEDTLGGFIREPDKTKTTDAEVFNSLQAAIAFKLTGKTHKAMKLFEHAATIAPKDADVLNHYGEFLEEMQKDIVTADELYVKALAFSPDHQGALMNHKRTAQVVDKMDCELFKNIDEKHAFLKDNLNNLAAIRKQAYYLHIYHTVGIEGNTMSVEQLRHLLETGQVIDGKSLIEHNEIMGLALAMKYVKLLTRIEYIGVREILGIHRRVMGHVDPLNSGVFRNEKVFVGSHVPPPPEDIAELMENYVEWLNSEEAQSMHPVRYAALAHYKLVDIHPFSDGNGRTSRLVMNLILLREGYPPVMILKEQRERYYDSLNTANMGDVRLFVRFIAQCTLQILEMYITGTQPLSIDSDKLENQVIANPNTS